MCHSCVRATSFPLRNQYLRALAYENNAIQCSSIHLRGDPCSPVQGELRISLTGQHAHADWAKKADWSAGGIVARPAGKQPKAPITAQQAYAQYLIAQAEKDFHEAAPNSAEHQSSTAMLKVDNSCIVAYPFGIAFNDVRSNAEAASHKAQHQPSNASWVSWTSQHSCLATPVQA